MRQRKIWDRLLSLSLQELVNFHDEILEKLETVSSYWDRDCFQVEGGNLLTNQWGEAVSREKVSRNIAHLISILSIKGIEVEI